MTAHNPNNQSRHVKNKIWPVETTDGTARKRRGIGFLVVMLVLLALACEPAFAMPPLPATCWGTVSVNGATVPPGTVVSAWVDGVQVTSTTTQTIDGASYYIVHISATSEWVPEGSPPNLAGKPVLFRVGSYVASQTMTWQTGATTRLDLDHHAAHHHANSFGHSRLPWPPSTAVWHCRAGRQRQIHPGSPI